MNGREAITSFRAEARATAERTWWLGFVVGVACGFGLGLFVAAVIMVQS